VENAGLKVADIDRASFVYPATNPGEDAVLLLTTHSPYNRDKVRQTFVPNGAEITVSGKPLYQGKNPDGVAVALINPRVFLMGSSKGVRNLMEPRKEGAFTAVLRSVDPRHPFVAAFVPGSAQLDQMRAALTPETERLRPQIDMKHGTLVASLVGSHLEMEATLFYADEGQAEKARLAAEDGSGFIRGLLVMMKSQAGDRLEGESAQKLVARVEQAVKDHKMTQTRNRVSLPIRLEYSTTGGDLKK
jgi:hypothetical protein